MTDKFAVIGLGRFGSSVAATLAEKGAEVLGIDSNEEKVDHIRDDVAYAVTLDATDIRALKAQNVQDLDVVVVAIGKDFEALLLCTVHLLNLNVKRIIARAMNPTQRMILEKMGVHEIISPEVEVGVSLAERILNPGIVNFVHLPDNYEIVEINAPANVVNRAIEELELRKRYKLNLITIKRKQLKKGNQPEEHIVEFPDPSTIVESTDNLIVLGQINDINRFIEVNQ